MPAFREGLRLAPEDPDLALELGRLMHRLGGKDEAADAYLAVARSNPLDVRARGNLDRLGLCAGGIGVIALFKFLAVADIWQMLSGPRLDWGASLFYAVLAILAVAGFITVGMRIRGTRTLSPTVRRGLRPEHRNAALRWLRLIAIVALVYAAWSVAVPASRGRGRGPALGLAIFAMIAGYAVHRLWQGPRRGPAEVARGLWLRFAPRRP